MKKVIVSILALACGLCAYAKTLDELIEGMPDASSSIKGVAKLRASFMEENRADFARELAAYISSDASVKDYGEMSGDELRVRKLLVPFYSKYGKSLTVPDAVAIRLSPSIFFNITGLDKYEQIKAAGWKIDGKELKPATIFFYAKAAKDDSYKASITIEQAKEGGFLVAWAKDKAKSLYYAKDAKSAYEETLAIEAALRTSDIKNAQNAIPAIIEVQDFLHLKFVRENQEK